MKLTIEKISRKQVTTSRGESWSIRVLSSDVWYSAWAAEWNRGWREGQTINVKIKQNGNFWNIVGPEAQEVPSDSKILDEILNNQTQIMKEILEIKKLLDPPKKIKKPIEPEEPPPHTEEDMPGDLPF